MKKLLLVGVLVTGIYFTGTSSLYAVRDNKGEAPKDKKERKAKKEKEEDLPIVDVSATGKISKTETKARNGKVKELFILTDNAGNIISLPAPKSGGRENKTKDEKELDAPKVFNYADFLEVEVIISGKGTEKTLADKVIITFKEITSIEKK